MFADSTGPFFGRVYAEYLRCSISIYYILYFNLYYILISKLWSGVLSQPDLNQHLNLMRSVQYNKYTHKLYNLSLTTAGDQESIERQHRLYCGIAMIRYDTMDTGQCCAVPS